MPFSVAKHLRKTQKPMISDNVLSRLSDDIAFRRIDSGIEWLDDHRSLLSSLDPARKNAAALVGYLAQWVDIGFDNPRLAKELLSRFTQGRRATLPLLDYLHLRMAEGYAALSEENLDSAVRHFETVLSFENEIQDKQIVSIANFWLGRCHRTMGRYDSALSFTVKGKELALQMGYPKMAAVMQVLESWLIFQEGRPRESSRILKDAEATLAETSDYVTRGNIQSAYGRIARRQGRYAQALQHFAASIEELKKRNPRHRNLARALANIAFVKRLIAVRLCKKIDRSAAQRWKSKRRNDLSPASPKLRDRLHLERLRAEALAHLDQAEEIYASHDDHRGLGTIHVNRGLLYLDGGDLDAAAGEGAEAYRLGEDKKDFILEARARILQSTVENAKFEEQIEEKSALSHRAQLACDYARNAVECAKQTQNRRLLAKAYIIQGYVLSNDFFDDPSEASDFCDKAAALLKPDGQDYVSEDLQALRRKVVNASGIDPTLRQWSLGIVGDKSFQQIAEEFAGIVIPKVWRREGRKISRVAARLSISPKKVRRVLTKQGLLRGNDERAV